LPNIGSVAGDPSQYQEGLIKFVAAQGIALSYDQAIRPARGISEGGKITLLPGMTGTASQDYIQLYNGDAKLLLDRLERVRSAASPILEGIGH
jgi:hypothetical protein